MRWLKVLCIGILLLAVGFIGVMFTVNNTDKVSINLIVATLPEASLSIWLLCFFAAGAIASLFLSSLWLVVLKTKLRASRRRELNIKRQLEQAQSSTAVSQATGS